jgi:hypothetical protein
MKTRTLLRRAVKVRQIGDQQALERKRLALEAEAAADVKGAERRRQELFMSIHFPEGTDPLHASLKAYGCKPEQWARYEPDESNLGDVIKRFVERPEVQTTIEIVRDDETLH